MLKTVGGILIVTAALTTIWSWAVVLGEPRDGDTPYYRFARLWAIGSALLVIVAVGATCGEMIWGGEGALE